MNDHGIELNSKRLSSRTKYRVSPFLSSHLIKPNTKSPRPLFSISQDYCIYLFSLLLHKFSHHNSRGEMSNGIVERALNSLGKGFGLTSDFKLKYCKGKERLVLLNETHQRDINLPGFGPIKNVSIDIKCGKGDLSHSDILEFNKSSILGKIPSGYFNAMFNLESGSWTTDAAHTKYWGLDGYFITLFNLHSDRYPLVLSDEILGIPVLYHGNVSS
ncbi:hypothetical protein Pint_33092 [Pistacia integerrima]|uniref:Uncharacterized protein n=1 Tax=Pistacia integerrima TaxID=434235 RepID=A0ACC0X592_9ROSI|nr:hypothetical protein Pint_33092 [Pistacia integerrima]